MPPLPPPALSFTIPSIQEDVTLDCRVYHPACLAPTVISHVTQWNKKAAIVAHPYAPLGGSMDDPVVGVITSLLLKQGFVVGTFNFRGAGASKGRTSWLAKAEQKDYISMIGFMVYYMHHLSPQSIPFDLPRFTRSDPELHDLSPVPSQTLPTPRSTSSQYLTDPSGNVSPYTSAVPVPKEDYWTTNSQPRLLLAGYSYGALITSLLPPIISSTITQFQTPTPGSAYAEIRLRAKCLAVQQNEEINTQISGLLQIYIHQRGRSLNTDDTLLNQKTRKPNGGVRMGGGEDLRRASHDSFRSKSSFAIDAPEMVRKSVDRVRSIGKSKRMSPKRHNTHDSLVSLRSGGHESQRSIHKTLPDEKEAESAEKSSLEAIPDILNGLQMAYLLVSPLHGIVNNLATMWTSKAWKGRDSVPENEMKFTVDPTLAVFGDDDIFVSIKRLRAWSEKLASQAKEGGDGQFQYTEVAGAGHFWHDYQAVKILQDEIKTFVRDL